MTPKLSVIMTVYNGDKYIKESLDSVFGQLYQNFELIIVNDGSTDKSKDIILQYVNNPKVIFLENKHNEGIPFSRNKALLAAHGEYVAIHDADDVTLPKRFTKQVEILDTCKRVAFLGGHAIRISDQGQVIGSMSYPPEDTEEALKVIREKKLNPIIDPTCMYRRQVILDIGAYRMEDKFRTVSDFDLWCRLLVGGHSLYNVQEPVIKYRINPQGLTRIKKDEMVEATDEVWAAFKRRNFPRVKLRPEAFREDSDDFFMNP